MEFLKIVFGILSFAFVTSILYIWGIKKSQYESINLSELLYKKGEERIIKYLKKNNTITNSEIKGLIMNMKAGFFYSKNRAVVKDADAFLKTLTKRMTDNNIITKMKEVTF